MSQPAGPRAKWYAGWGGPACVVQVLCRLGLNGLGRPAIPPLNII